MLRFYPSKVKEVIQRILDDYFEGRKYDLHETPEHCETLSKEIRKSLTPKDDMRVITNDYLYRN